MGTTYKIGIVGFGNIAENGHSVAINNIDSMDIVAICDKVVERSRVAKIKYPSAKFFFDLEEMLNESAIDILVICTPPNSHYNNIVLGLKYNCHIICEKPLLSTPIQFNKVNSLSRQMGKIVYPCHNYIFDPVIQRIKELIDNEEIGTIKILNTRTIRPTHALGTITASPDWRRDKIIGLGGILTDHGVHNIYVTFFLLSELPKSYAGSIHSMGTSTYNTEDTAILTLLFNNCTCNIYLSWNGTFRSNDFYIEGERGVISVNNDILIIRKKGNKTVIKETLERTNYQTSAHSLLYKNMYKSIIHHLDLKIHPNKLFNNSKIANKIIHDIYSQDSSFNKISYKHD